MSLEAQYAELRQLIEIGKEKGYLLYDEVTEARIDRQVKTKTRRQITDEEKRRITGRQRELRALLRSRTVELEQPVAAVKRTLHTVLRGEILADVAKKELVEATSVS